MVLSDAMDASCLPLSTIAQAMPETFPDAASAAPSRLRPAAASAALTQMSRDRAEAQERAQRGPDLSERPVLAGHRLGRRSDEKIGQLSLAGCLVELDPSVVHQLLTIGQA